MKTKRCWLHVFVTPLLLTLILFLSGCASTTYWTWEHKEDFSRSQLQKDRQECRRIAQIEANQSNLFYNDWYDPFYWSYRSHRNNHDPFYWSWYRHDRFLRYQDDLDRYYFICMRAKGWERVKKNKADKLESNNQSD
jgi:hypothetical protein